MSVTDIKLNFGFMDLEFTVTEQDQLIVVTEGGRDVIRFSKEDTSKIVRAFDEAEERRQARQLQTLRSLSKQGLVQVKKRRKKK